MCEETGAHAGTTLEGIVQGCLDQFSDDEIELLGTISAAADRPLNWNVLTIDAREPDRVPAPARRRRPRRRARRAARRAHDAGRRADEHELQHLLRASGCCRVGRRSWACRWPSASSASPIPTPASGCSSARCRRRPACSGGSPTGATTALGDVYAEENEPYRGRIVGDIAAERGKSNFGTLLDIVIADDLRTVLWPVPKDDDGASWELRRQVWNDPRAMLGGSDAGAHLDRMCGAPYTTRFLADCIRGRQLVSLERAVQLITSAPAAALRAPRPRACCARARSPTSSCSIPRPSAPRKPRSSRDLPGDSARLTAGSHGVVRVLVNGTPIVEEGKATGATPGTVLRSGPRHRNRHRTRW